MICEKCGAQLPEKAKFCLECGNPINTPEPEEVKSVFDELQVEEVDSDSFFGQFSESPIEEVNPPVIEDNSSIVEKIEDVPLQEEVVSDPFGITPPTEQVNEVVDTLPNPKSEIPINIPNPIPETPVSAAMPDLSVDDKDIEKPVEPITTTVMNSGSVNQTTMSGVTAASETNEAPAQPNMNIVQMASNVDRSPESVDDLLTDSTMNPPPLNSKDNSFAQPNFDQYSVNMMYGSNTEEEQYLRMQKEQLQPAKAFDKGSNPLPGAGSNVVSDFGNTYGNGLNNNTNVNAYQNNIQKNPQQMQQPMQKPQVNPYVAPKTPQPQAPTTFGSQLNQNPQEQPPQATSSNVKDPTKKKSPVGKIIVVLLLLIIIGALGYVFYPYIMDFINNKKNPSANTVPTINTTAENIVHMPTSANSIEIQNTTTNSVNETNANQISGNTTSAGNSVAENSVEGNNTVANVINLNGTSNNTTTSQNTVSNTTRN